MSVTSINCPGFETTSHEDGIGVQEMGNTIPVIIHEVGDRVKVLCIALLNGQCRKEDLISDLVVMLKDKEKEWKACPYVQLFEKAAAEGNKPTEEIKPVDKKTSADLPPDSQKDFDLLAGKAIR